LMAARTDIHRAASADFDPTAYSCLGVYDLETDDTPLEYRIGARLISLREQGYKPADLGERSGAAVSTCGHCGAWLRYAALMVHEATKTYMTIGEQCLGNRFDAGLTAEQFQALRKVASLNRERTARKGKVEAVLAEHPDLRAATDSDNSFVVDVMRKLHKYGNLSDAQIAAVKRALIRDAEWKVKRAAQHAEDAKSEFIAEVGKRITLTAEVVATKPIESFYGDKLFIMLRSGDDIAVTFYSGMDGYEKGETVTIKATVKAHETRDGIKQTMLTRIARQQAERR
jgi:hypothetical protein